VEQNCIYLDLDGKDKIALHLYGEFERRTSLLMQGF
jgi:ElaA protein